MANFLRQSKLMGTVNFTKGINDANQKDKTGIMMQKPVPYRNLTFFEDFLQYNLADYTVTKVEAGSGAATIAPGNTERNGALVITNDNAANDQVNIMLGNNSSTGNGAFHFDASEDLWFDCRLKLSDMSSSNIEAFVGLCNPDTSLGIFDSKDCLGFFFDSLIGSFPLFISSNSSNGGNFEGNNTLYSELNIQNNEYFNLSIIWNSKEKSITAFINDRVFSRRRFNLGDPLNLLGKLPGAGMTPLLQLKNLNTATNSMTVDYIWVGQERKERF
tara:strand:- start:1068 stop:1886 length:819 start_codon:yes stop_codon:yes gene_type:complete